MKITLEVYDEGTGYDYMTLDNVSSIYAEVDEPLRISQREDMAGFILSANSDERNRE